MYKKCKDNLLYSFLIVHLSVQLLNVIDGCFIISHCGVENKIFLLSCWIFFFGNLGGIFSRPDDQLCRTCLTYLGRGGGKEDSTSEYSEGRISSLLGMYMGVALVSRFTHIIFTYSQFYKKKRIPGIPSFRKLTPRFLDLKANSLTSHFTHKRHAWIAHVMQSSKMSMKPAKFNFHFLGLTVCNTSFAKLPFTTPHWNWSFSSTDMGSWRVAKNNRGTKMSALFG